MFERFTISKPMFRLCFRDGLFMPSFPSSTFRGGIGYALKKATCAQRGRDDCAGCLLAATCPYNYLFEGLEGIDVKLPGLLMERKPKPFSIAVLEDTGLQGKEKNTHARLNPGDEIRVEVTLAGESARYFPYVVMAVATLGENGFSRERARFEIIEIQDACAGMQPIFGPEKKCLLREPARKSMPEIRSEILKRIAVSHGETGFKLILESPLRLKSDGRFTDSPDFRSIARSALARASALAGTYGQPLESEGFDPFRWLETAKKVSLRNSRTRWFERERFSTRQGSKMTFGGIVGEMDFSGPDDERLHTMLALMEMIGAGKASTFGLGRLRVGALGSELKSASPDNEKARPD